MSDNNKEIQNYMGSEIQDTQTSVSDEYSIQATRAMKEVEAQVLLAKRFPRNEQRSLEKILNSCKRKNLAMTARYSYPRGGQNITGPTIHLAKVIAKNWGNMTTGIQEIEQRDGESIVEAFCWDLETNVRESKIFRVKHERKANGQIKKLTDPRDIYELIANYGSRRQRACILSIIPSDVIDLALAECQKTMIGDNSQPLQDRIRNMIKAFETVNVTVKMLEEKAGKETGDFTVEDLVDYHDIYNSLKDKNSKISDWFGGKVEKSEESKNLSDSILKS